ncbi:ABC transporter permease [Halorubellus sp. JP-L1]|uniref:ABC transporter permease n=1 Tax=Halorubellus sp. JP-L1 TaxID=2715753 RepID=UPI00140A7EB3|nr:ABC transporter permease [Halorubellus sp. JP-L1]NHN41732.1 ABC transporter permease [Halorubellus sp. JP-L1]
MSWRAIRAHKLRSTLTTLGVVIGVAAVLTFVILGASLQAGVIGDVSPDDRENVYGWAAPPDTNGGPGAGAQPVFTPRDLERIEQEPAVEAAYGFQPVPTQTLSARNETVPRGSGVYATGPAYVDAEDVAQGRQFRAGEREAVLNPAAAALFDPNLSIGDEIAIQVPVVGTVNATVVGITEDAESRSPFEGFNPEPRVYVPTDPYVTDVTQADRTRFSLVVVEATDQGSVDDARDQALAYLNSSESDAAGFGDEDLAFNFQTSLELLDQFQELFDVLQNFVVGVAGISLLVGSIGIANIMLVSVTERTREIGIMKAVGAQRRDILQLFIVEAVVLGVVGSILGLVLGLVAGYGVAQLVGLEQLVVPWEWGAIAVVVGIAVGVLAGLYPAYNASKTDPIDALRYE